MGNFIWAFNKAELDELDRLKVGTLFAPVPQDLFHLIRSYNPKYVGVIKTNPKFKAEYNLNECISPEGVITGTAGSHDYGKLQQCMPWGMSLLQNGDLVVVSSHDYTLNIFRQHRFFRSIKLPNGKKHKCGAPSPVGLSVDKHNNILVAILNRHQVWVYNEAGKRIRRIGKKKGSQDGQFDQPYDVASDRCGNLVVADAGNRRIQTLSPEGTFIRKFGSLGPEPNFSFPTGVRVTPQDNILVVDHGHRGVSLFTPEGQHLWSLSSLEGGLGTSSQIFTVAVDAVGNVIVPDRGQDRICIFDKEGKRLLKTLGVAKGEFREPVSAVVDGEGNLIVVDNYPHRIQVFG